MRNKEMVRTLSVKLSPESLPQFEFSGEWNGNDISIVQRLLLRQYRLKQRSMRRSNNTIKEDANERAK